MGCSHEEKTPKENQPKESQQQMEQTETIKVQQKTDEPKEIIEYFNNEYGFTLNLPASWKGKYVVKKGNWDSQAEAIYDFNYPEGETNLFSVLVLNISKEEWDRDYASGLWGYLGEKDGKVFAYAIPSELPNEWQQDKQSKVTGLIDITKMVNIDVPYIVKTFKLVR